MNGSIPERDWKIMKKIKDELLACLCEKINKKSVDILNENSDTEHEKYLKHFRHVQVSDKIIGNCFDDWRRSTLFTKLINLQNQNLLSKENFGCLSEETQKRLKAFLEIQK